MSCNSLAAHPNSVCWRLGIWKANWPHGVCHCRLICSISRRRHQLTAGHHTSHDAANNGDGNRISCYAIELSILGSRLAAGCWLADFQSSKFKLQLRAASSKFNCFPQKPKTRATKASEKKTPIGPTASNWHITHSVVIRVGEVWITRSHHTARSFDRLGEALAS